MTVESKYLNALAVTLLSISNINMAHAADAESITQAFVSGKTYADFRLRFEAVDQNNALRDAEALTLRSRLGYKTAKYLGLSAVIELEDSRTVLGVNNFSVPQTGFNTGEYSVIADPKTTEVDQAFLQYGLGDFNAKIGRQVITLDNHRFVGHVGWRQDRQTFDGVTLSFKPKKGVNFNLSQLVKRNRIFADESDIDSSDTLINISYKTDLGTLTAYAYLLEVDDIGPNSIDTFGARFVGSSEIGSAKAIYTVEFANQETNNSIDTDYVFIEAGAIFKGVTAKVGFESLGSDQGNGGFATPLATLHKFNGWTDQFLSTPEQGLEDIYLTLSGKLAGGKLSVIYHDFSADVSSPNGDDLGSEVNVVYSKNFGKHYYAGAKYGDYSAGVTSFGKVDTDKLWLWAGVTF